MKTDMVAESFYDVTHKLTINNGFRFISFNHLVYEDDRNTVVIFFTREMIIVTSGGKGDVTPTWRMFQCLGTFGELIEGGWEEFYQYVLARF